MPLRVQPGNWEKFIQRYRRDPSQWYLIPKAKTYDEESIKLLIRGLGLLHEWFCEPDQLSVNHRELLKNYLRENQSRLFPDEPFAVKWGDAARVFFAAKLFEEGILSREQQDPPLKKGRRRQPRPLLVESLETARKNVNFLTLSGPWQRRKIGDSDGIVLTDEDKAAKILAEDKNLQFVDFDSKEAWFSYFGDTSRKYDDVEAAIEYYAKTGKASKAKKLVRKASDSGRARTLLQQKLKEKQIEDLFVKDNLELLETGLRLYKEGQRTGQQFDTPDAGTIDLLTIAADKSFVVIEFKRNQISDQAVGQVLRYMGWVRKHLSPSKAVRGYVVASDFDRLIRYSLIGMQHPEIPNRRGKDLIQLHRHGFDPARVGRVNIDELSG